LEVPVGLRYGDAWQHTGLGRRLLVEAENAAREQGANRILVLSALGTKGYYKRAGYTAVGPYVGKALN
jgi:elongator complex protein 3